MAVEGVALFFELESLQQLFGVRAVVVELREKLDGLFHAQLVGQGRGLQDGADLCLNSSPLFPGSRPQTRDDAAVGRAQPFEDFDGAGLAGAVGPEQAENFAFFDSEAQPRTASTAP